MKDFLIWIKNKNFVHYKDGKWYIPGSWRPWKPTIYYTEDELIDLYEKETRNETNSI